MKTKNKYIRCSKILEAKFREKVRLFAADLDASQIGISRLNRNTVNRYLRAICERALRKLRQLDAAQVMDDLRNPPGNRLEALGGGREGQWSIRINGQWRICFVWREGEAHQVEIVDYH